MSRPARRPPTVARAPSAGALGTAARFAARARAARWRLRRQALAAVAGVVVVVGLIAFAYAGPALVVREVTVSGVSQVRTQQVLAVAEAPQRRPLARVDTGAIAERVRTLPFVAGVQVQRGWPSTLRIVVDARTPAALVPDRSGGYRVVDATGVAFASSRAAVKGVPVVQVALDESDRPALRAALAVLAALPTPMRATVTAVTASSPDDVQLRVGASTVVWGSPERSDRKAAIYAALRRTPATVYDLSSPETPVLR